MRAKMKKECVRDFFALGKEWDGHERKRAVGYINSEMLWEDQEERRFCMVVHFTSKEAYLKNANRSEERRVGKSVDLGGGRNIKKIERRIAKRNVMQIESSARM